MFFFFFQAEDGIRDRDVTEFRRVLFRSEISFHESLKVHSSTSHTGELAATMNDNTTFLPLNSSKVLIFNSVSGSSKFGARSPTFNAIRSEDVV